MSKEPLTSGDLCGFGRMAERHWRMHLPKLVKELEKEGTLYDRLQEAGENANNMLGALLKQGVNPEAAREMALHEYILLDPRTFAGETTDDEG